MLVAHRIMHGDIMGRPGDLCSTAAGPKDFHEHVASRSELYPYNM